MKQYSNYDERKLSDAIAIFLVCFILGFSFFSFETKAQLQKETFFVTIHAGGQWGSIECHEENPFVSEITMDWSVTEGLTEINHSEGLVDPLIIIIEVDEMTLQTVYTHLGEQFLIGWQCPIYTEETLLVNGIPQTEYFKNVHIREHEWGYLR